MAEWPLCPELSVEVPWAHVLVAAEPEPACDSVSSPVTWRDKLLFLSQEGCSPLSHQGNLQPSPGVKGMERAGWAH